MPRTSTGFPASRHPGLKQEIALRFGNGIYAPKSDFCYYITYQKKAKGPRDMLLAFSP